jgi:hypothetical protein
VLAGFVVGGYPPPPQTFAWDEPQPALLRAARSAFIAPLLALASGLGALAERMLGYGISALWFRYGMQRFGVQSAPSGRYADPTAAGSPMPSPHLERKLKEALGDDAGAELAAVTDRIDPIRGDMAELRHTLRGDMAELRHTLRGDIAELRHTMEQRFTALEGRMDARIEGSAKEQTRFFFVAWGVLLAAIVVLYGTVVALLR